MNQYSREQLMDMFGYSFQVLKAVSDLNNAIRAEQNKAYNGMMGNYEGIRKKYNIGSAVLVFVGLLCNVIIDGNALSLTEFIIAFAVGFGLLWLMFSPFFMVLKFIYKHFAKKEFTNAKTNDASNSYRQKGEELLQDSRFLEYKGIIPATYFNQNDLYLLYSYLENYRADDFKEAANLLAEEKHRDQVEYNQELMQQSLASIQSNVRYQSVIQTIQLLETKKINTNLEHL